jgi:hypothetical protein
VQKGSQDRIIEPAAGDTRRVPFFIKVCGRFLPETPEALDVSASNDLAGGENVKTLLESTACRATRDQTRGITDEGVKNLFWRPQRRRVLLRA